MLVFGPYRSIPKEEQFVVYNFSSSTQVVPRLPGLFISPEIPMQMGISMNGDGEVERGFDMWYYDYVLNDPTACTSLMQILMSLYNGNNVYVCIADYGANSFISMMNESFMKIIQTRYDIGYSIINDPEDFEYIPKDGCDFMSVDGIFNFDADRKRFMILSTEDSIMHGGVNNENY